MNQQQYPQGQYPQQGQPSQYQQQYAQQAPQQQPGPNLYQAQFQQLPQASSGPPPKVRTPPAILSPLWSVAREFRGLFAVPLAFFGGLFGAIVLSGALVFVMWWLEENAEASPIDQEEFSMDFEPGALTKLGVEPKDIPEKAINEETRTPEDVKKEAVTEDEKPPEEQAEKKPVEEKPKDNKPINKNKDAKISDKNRTDNNPYAKDLPNNIDPTGDPFGDPNGWADMKKDGDPWATSVMAALNAMKVPGYAGKIPPGTYKFKLKICKDGKVSQVLTKKGSGNSELDNRVRGELERLEIPKPPSNVVKKMKASCVTLNYIFSWSSGKVK